MRVLVLGASGLVGRNLVRYFRGRAMEVHGTCHRSEPEEGWEHRLDVTSRSEVERLVARLRPRLVVQAAGLTRPARCEEAPEEAWRVNALGARWVAEACARSGSRLMHLSTDLVFGGRRGGYREHDPTRPLSAYGRTKLAGEWAVLSASPAHCVLRPGILLGPALGAPKGSLLEWIRDSLEEGRPIEVDADGIRSFLWIEDLAGAVLQLHAGGVSGILHLAAESPMTRSGLALTLARRLDLDEGLVRPVAYEELGIAVPLARDTSLRCDRAAPLLRRLPRRVEELLSAPEACRRPLPPGRD